MMIKLVIATTLFSICTGQFGFSQNIVKNLTGKKYTPLKEFIRLRC